MEQLAKAVPRNKLPADGAKQSGWWEGEAGVRKDCSGAGLLGKRVRCMAGKGKRSRTSVGLTSEEGWRAISGRLLPLPCLRR